MINQILSQKFAEFMGIDPLYFNNISLQECGIEDDSICSVYWEYHRNRQYPSKLALDEAIYNAKHMIAEHIKLWVEDEWIEGEKIDIPTHYATNAYMKPLNNIVFKSKYPIKSGGIRDIIKIDTVTLTYIDEDGDGFEEKATFSFELPVGITLKQIKTAYVNTNNYVGLLNLELNGTKVSGFIYSYELVKPELFLKRSFAKENTFDGCGDIYVDELDVVYEKVDECLTHASILVEKNCSTTPCEYESIPACIKIIDECEGLFRIIPGEYVDNCFVPTTQSCSLDGRPISISINYLSSIDEHTQNLLLSPLFKLAASIMIPVNCSCDCYEASIAMWQNDVNIKGNNGIEYRYPSTIRNNAIWNSNIGAIEAQMFLESLITICD